MEQVATYDGIEDDAEEISPKASTGPSFPVVMFFAALFKDILDSLDLTGFGVILTTMLAVVLGAILYLWSIMKVGLKGGKAKKKLAIRIASTLIIEIIPGLKILPAASIFVVLVWKSLVNEAKESHS